MENSSVRNITVQTLKEMQDYGDDFQLIDVREADERAIAEIGGDHIPLAEIDKRVNEIQRGKAVILYCKSGLRSRIAIRFLQQEHELDNLYNLHGGIMAYARDIDPSITLY